MNNRLANILFFVLFFMCMNTHAEDSKLIHRETIENQHRIMTESLRSLEDNNATGRGSTNETNVIVVNNNTKNDTGDKNKKDNGFWKGFINSLSMIFFVEFGDRVYLYLLSF
jgi:hypothetical protein